MRNYGFKALTGTLVLGFGLVVMTAHGQPEKVYEDFVDNIEISKAIAISYEPDGNERTPEMLAIFARIAQENPGTTLGATALLLQANYATPTDATSIYQSVIAAYPRSNFEIQARLNMVERQYQAGTLRRWSDLAVACDNLAQSYGGPSLRELSQGNQDKAARKIHALPVEYQKGLIYVYEMLEGSLSMAEEHAKAVPVAQLIRDQFFQFLDGPQPSRDLEFQVVLAQLGTWPGTRAPLVNPTVRLVTHEREAGPRPKFVLELYTGPYPTPMVDLSSLKVLLDGQDFRPNLVASSRIRQGMRGHKNLLFEESIRLSGRPKTRLARGPHTLDVTVNAVGYDIAVGTGPGNTHKIFSFTVGRDRDDDDDDQDGECWDR